MPINNEGRLLLSEVLAKQVNQDWPAANTDYDLYVQDLIASGNVIANGLIVRNIEVSGNILTGNIIAASIRANTLTLDIITANTFVGIDTDQVAEGSNNLYFTLSRAREAYTAGLGIAISTGGVISAKGDDTGTGMFNSGINISVGQLVSNVYANLATFSAVDGDSFIIYSLHATNITGNTVYLNGRYVIDNKNAANTVLFANLFEIPGNTSLELLRKPQVFKPDDQIQLLSYSDPRQPANDLVSVYMSYQASQDTAYKRVANTITNNQLTEVFTTPAQTSIIESFVLNNLSPNVIPVTSFIMDGSDNVVSYLTANLSVPARTSVEICEYPKAMPENYKIKVNKFGAVNDQLSVFITSKFTTYYAITSASTVNEGDSITFNIETLNIGNGTTLYYTLEEVSGNITQNDFVTPISGEVTVQNDSAVLTLQSNADATSFTEGPDIFRLQLRKGSTFGTIVTTGSNVTILDTSNTRTALINVSGLTSSEPNITVEGDVLTITVNTTNFQNNDTLYYSMTGNALNTYFVEGNTGTLIVTDNSNTFTLTTTGIPTNTTRTFDIEIRDTDENGELLINSGLMTVWDVGVAYSSATGGTVFTEADPVTGENYKVHVFTTSGNFSVSKVGQLYPNVEYVVVGGGGSGGNADSPGFGRSGGGGAGGFVTGNIVLTPGTKVMSIGGGGAAPIFPVTNFQGGNTGFFGNVVVAYGGGKGARANTPSAGGNQPYNRGGIGGSGGGYSTDGSWPPSTIPAGNAYDPAQGNPGGLAGGGAGGPGAAPLYGRGLAVTWLSNASYGTDGPTPGRWFAGGGAGGNAPSAIVPAGGGGVHLDASPWSTAGNVNTGGGGAGGSSPVGPSIRGGLNGGSGIIIVRYRTQ